MKNNILYITLLAIGILFNTACENEYDVDEFFDLTDLPGYVAFNAPGTAATLDDLTVDEGSGVATLTIECPTGTLSDITVDFSISGDAVFGTDFTIANATASSGTIVIEHDPADFQNTDNADIEITVLTDGVVDGDKTLTITLVSASNADGDLAVGRGGTDFLKSANVIIQDID